MEIPFDRVQTASNLKHGCLEVEYPGLSLHSAILSSFNKSWGSEYYIQLREDGTGKS